jgi:hypothetical protein
VFRIEKSPQFVPEFLFSSSEIPFFMPLAQQFMPLAQLLSQKGIAPG